MPDYSPQYENILNKQMRAAIKKILQLYQQAITDISIVAYLQNGTGSQAITGKTFTLDAAPALKKAINKLISGLHADIVKAIQKAVNDAWDLSNEKNDKITKQLIGDAVLDATAAQLIFNHNGEALKAFSKRVESGMNLSTRVWNLIRPYKFELEAGLTEGINAGRSAADMATQLKKYLKEPDKLFRRVRDKNGKFQLSRAAKAYHPGQGVYRSSFKNALRLTASETNMAYRTADNERWSVQPFVKAIKVETSNNHPLYDECDVLAGTYPKDFLFRGWHPRCLCHAIPVLVSDKEFNQQEDEMLGISKKKPDVKYVDAIPAKAKKWIEENSERIKGWKNTPYFITDNKKYVSL
jgi:hypothetical protein